MDQASGLRKLVQKNSARAQANMGENILPQSPRVMAVTSGKGGVGKTNIVGNLAVAFARQGKRVLIIDADLGLANIDIIFGLRPEYDIRHVISGEKRISEIIVKTEDGVSVIPGGSGFSELSQLTEGEKLNLLSEFETLDRDMDVVLIDTGAGISSNVIYFNLAAEECYVVSTFEPTSITDAYAMIKIMSSKHGVKRFKLLVNMVEAESEAKAVYASLSQAVDRFLSGVVLEYVGFVPADKLLKEAVIQRGTVLDLYPNSLAGKKFMELGKQILSSPRRFDADGNIKFFMQQVMDCNS